MIPAAVREKTRAGGRGPLVRFKCGGSTLSAPWEGFEDLATGPALDFTGRYARSFGVDGPLPSSLGESCYEGLSLYAALVRRARSLERRDLLAAADGAVYEGPRGVVGMRGAHSVQDVYLARARDLEFEVISRLWSGPSGLPSDSGWCGGSR